MEIEGYSYTGISGMPSLSVDMFHFLFLKLGILPGSFSVAPHLGSESKLLEGGEVEGCTFHLGRAPSSDGVLRCVAHLFPKLSAHVVLPCLHLGHPWGLGSIMIPTGR